MQFSAKIDQKMGKFGQKNKPFLTIKHWCVKKTVKIDDSTYESVQQVGVSGSVPSGF